MLKVFISYRRADSANVTDNIYEHMERHFGEENVFLDVGDIPPGVDFRQYLRDQIATHDVVMVIIGTDWARIMQERANQANDFVRIEIENALAMGKHIVPILVNGTQMPDFSQLPAGISNLQWLNAAVIRREPDFPNDCQRLADGIRKVMESSSKAPETNSISVIDLAKSFTGKRNSDWTPVIQSFEANGLELEMCLVPSGTFQMGNDNGRDNAKPVHEQTINSSYWIGVHPITNQQWRQAVEQSAGVVKVPEWADWYEDTAKNNHPVVAVTWVQCMEFIKWLGQSWRLPTELEWEYAARGVESLVYPFGNEFEADKVAYRGNLNVRTATIGGRPQGASWVGAHDMSGNVWDWTSSLFEAYPYDASDGRENISSDNGRVFRGGAFPFKQPSARASFRYFDYPYNGYYHNGVRLVVAPLG